MISHVIVTKVTKHDGYIAQVTLWSHKSQSQITQLYNTKKDIEGSGINDVIQDNNSILAL